MRNLLIVATPYQVVQTLQYTCMCTYTHINSSYGVATIGRLLKIIGLFCKRALQKRLYSAEETYNFKEEEVKDARTRTHTLQYARTRTRILQYARTRTQYPTVFVCLKELVMFR